MTADYLFSGLGHGENSGGRDGLALEGFVAGKAEDEGKTGGETSFECVQLLDEALADGDPATAEQNWHSVQQLQYDEGGYIVTTALNNVDGYSTKVRGIQTTEAGPCNYWDFKTAWLAS